MIGIYIHSFKLVCAYIQEPYRTGCFRRTGQMGNRDVRRKPVPVRVPAGVHGTLKSVIKGSLMKE